MRFLNRILLLLVAVCSLFLAGCIEITDVPGDGEYSNQTILNIGVAGYQLQTFEYKIGPADQIDCTVDDDLMGPIPANMLVIYDISGLPDGPVALCVKGAFSFNSGSVAMRKRAEWIKDTVAPGEFEITNDNPVFETTTPEFTWSSSESAATYNLTIAEDSTCTTNATVYEDLNGTTFIVPSVEEGTYFLCLESEDQAGNATTATNSPYEFTIDTPVEAPEFSWILSTDLQSTSLQWCPNGGLFTDTNYVKKDNDETQILSIFSIPVCLGDIANDELAISSIQRFKKAPGATSCPTGAYFTSGSDLNSNFHFDQNEIYYYLPRCDDDYEPAIIFDTVSLDQGSTCPLGGIRINIGFETNETEGLQTEEIVQEQVICHDFDYTVPVTGGSDNLAFIAQSLEPSELLCQNGGTQVSYGFDTDQNSKLDFEDERTGIVYLCLGTRQL